MGAQCTAALQVPVACRTGSQLGDSTAVGAQGTGALQGTLHSWGASSERKPLPNPTPLVKPVDDEVLPPPSTSQTDFQQLLVQLGWEHERELACSRIALEAEVQQLRAQVHQFQIGGSMPSRFQDAATSPRMPMNGVGSARTEPRELSLNSTTIDNCWVTSADPRFESAGLGLDHPDSMREHIVVRLHTVVAEHESLMKKICRLAGTFLSKYVWVPQDVDRGRKPAWNIAGKIVQTIVFDAICTVTILLKVILFGIATDYEARNHEPDEWSRGMEYIDSILSGWFLFEIILRMAAEGLMEFFSSANWAFNLFDSIVVLTDMAELVLAFMGMDENQERVLGNLGVMRILRVLRVLRALRIIRLIRFFKELRMMAKSVFKSAKTLLWSLLLLGIVVFCFGVYLTQNVTKHMKEMEGMEDHMKMMYDEGIHRILKDNFGSLLAAMFCLYMAVTGGNSWGDIALALVHVDWHLEVILSIYIFITMFSVLNIITGIFVDTYMSCAQNDTEEIIEHQLQSEDSTLLQIKHIFDAADKDNSGSITRQELKCHLDDWRVRAHLRILGLEVNRADFLFTMLDVDNQGQVGIEDFVTGCIRMKGFAKSIDLVSLYLCIRKMRDSLEGTRAEVKALAKIAGVRTDQLSSASRRSSPSPTPSECREPETSPSASVPGEARRTPHRLVSLLEEL